MLRLPAPLWQSRRDSHRARLLPFIGAHIERRKRAQKHPVWDFLFEYYSLKPSHLLRYSPGIGVELAPDATEFLNQKEFAPTRESGAAFLDPQQFPRHRVCTLDATLVLLKSTATRAPQYGCYGLHEWAMVYRANSTRHAQPLRLSESKIAEVVESQTLKCSHYDAFRFFTPHAAPLNLLHPTFDARPDFEQPGCLHANMDLYKWAAKFAPWTPSELVADTFELAQEARWLDMQAAPYDLREFGVAPIALETEAGRREYASLQAQIAQKAAPLRARLIACYARLRAAIEQ